MVKLFFPSQEILEKQREKLITGAIFDFGESNVSMYSKTHVLEDFIMFVACCKENGFDLHIDDTLIYNNFFSTPFARLWTHSGQSKSPHKDVRHID